MGKRFAFRGLAGMLVLALSVTVILFGASVAFASGAITQTPSFNGQNLVAGSSYTISWVSSGLAAGETLTLRFTNMTGPVIDVAVASGLPQSGSYAVTLPSGTIGSTYCYYLVSSGGTYSDAALTPWRFTLVASAVPGPGTITQTPNFNGVTLPAGSQLTINWTSTGLPGGATLVMRQTDMPHGYSDTVLASNLPQSGTYVATVPSGPVGSQYCFYLMSNATSPPTYSAAALSPWSFTIGAPVITTPASSDWSLALAAILGLGVVGVAARRTRLN